MMTFNSRTAVIAGLVGLIIATPWWLHVNNASLGLTWSIVLGAFVPVLLINPALRQSRNWTGIIALCMIPLACIGIMEIVASAGAVNSGTVIAIISIATFFAALDAGRRTPDSSTD
jgi:hypothetical protein